MIGYKVIEKLRKNIDIPVSSAISVDSVVKKDL